MEDDDFEVTEPVVLDSSDGKLVAELKHLRAEKRVIEKQEKRLREKLMQMLDGADVAMSATGEKLMELKHQDRVGIDKSRLEALYPDVFEEVTKVTRVTVLDLP